MYYLILNPVAGGGKLSKIQQRLKNKLSSMNLLGEFMKTSGDGDAENLARIAINKGYQTIIAVGGDSTVNEVINGIAGSDVTLGVIPIGYNNNFAKKISLPMNWQDALSVVAARNIESFDLGLVVEERYYFIMSAGLGAEISLCIRSKTEGFFANRLMFGEEAYFASILRESVPVHLRFIVDKQYAITLPVLSASIINSSFSKSGFLENDEFNNRDNLLDLVIIANPKDKAILEKMLKTKKSWNTYGNITKIQAREFFIESLDDQMKIHIDGRVLTKTPATVRVAPAKQRIIIGR